jgi:hypothetical protein
VPPYLDAYDSPPEVIRSGNDVLIRSPHNEACYTITAVKKLLVALQEVVSAAEAPSEHGE